MNWLRTRARALSLLALFALAVQFTLSFGHFHHDASLAGWSAHGPVQVTGSHTNADQDANDVCAICATMAMANTIVDAVAPDLPLPHAFTTHDVAFVSVAAIPETRRSSFRSRAPPQA